jgi:hypothetical protein
MCRFRGLGNKARPIGTSREGNDDPIFKNKTECKRTKEARALATKNQDRRKRRRESEDRRTKARIEAQKSVEGLARLIAGHDKLRELASLP